MPVFPTLRRRLMETSPSMSLFQGDPPPPMEPYGVNQGSFMPPPNISFDLPSGSSDTPPPAKSSAAGMRERIANQIRYEDIAPKLEPIPAAPPFQPKEKYGFLDRLKMAIAGMGMGSKDGRSGIGGIGGFIAGLINPAGVDRHGYAVYVRPQYQQEAQDAMARNKARLEAFDSELKGREIVAKINEANAPKYRQAAGSQYTMVFDEKTGEYIPAMIDGEPVEAASVVVGRGHDVTRRMVEKLKTQEAWNRLMAELQNRKDIAEMNNKVREAIAAAGRSAAMERLRLSERGKNERQKRELEAYGYEVDGGVGGIGPARPGTQTEKAPYASSGNLDVIEMLKNKLR